MAGHYGVLSQGEHGDTAYLKTNLLPLLLRYRVDVYLCGHDHTLQHLEDKGVHFFINGNGAKRGDLPFRSTAEKTLYADVHFGFMSHTIVNGSLR